MSASRIDAVRDGLFRATTYVDTLDLGFSQFFIRSPHGDVLCVETGTRANFTQLSAALDAVGIAPSMVSNVIVPHFEADEMGALPDFLAANPALVAYAHPMCAWGLADVFGVRAVPLQDGEPTTLSGIDVVPVFTKHVHQWDALVVYLPAYKALLSSDILMRFGTQDADDPLPAILDAIARADYLPSLAHLASALRRVQALDIDIVLPMHGPAITRDVQRVIAGVIAHCEAAAA
ncbi:MULTISPECIES: MBL fold metallo-hydrolase [Burkholderia]|jgi:glyoxylase-like metal-dependent hydrolase (beta-lactamase superfamily II)|uniref:Beta-lactamase domain protein n=1 Tax=Burkholderia vietnamiensis (strain G4 / LMG 22486) TaxID=269482 RepID=A4JJH4_BURVG|nr:MULTISPECIES: MBL fold metallo-hydrolase [Burkholderia]ABO56427.1 beta-lactamase domain protein [Burkholderia vietnamiensis G4]AFJ87423.1 beta-lactamase domain protein [Burkholderia sp. KJ006]AOK01784.1 MBL fold metallo-hydrolase [Burkholderia vietnamiensis]AOK44427.1 MBL fold metallo-hydrolase [Burkholderia vietnamiensis]KKI40414.1 beta-lactamase [Burkholderia vietnamiensis]